MPRTLSSRPTVDVCSVCGSGFVVGPFGPVPTVCGPDCNKVRRARQRREARTAQRAAARAAREQAEQERLDALVTARAVALVAHALRSSPVPN